MQQCALSFFNRMNKEICDFRSTERNSFFLFEKIKSAVLLIYIYIYIYISFRNITPKMFYKQKGVI